MKESVAMAKRKEADLCHVCRDKRLNQERPRVSLQIPLSLPHCSQQVKRTELRMQMIAELLAGWVAGSEGKSPI